MEKFNGFEKFDDLDKAAERAEQLNGVVIKYSIEKIENGKYEVEIYVYKAFDGFTKKVFVVTENDTRIRNVVNENENTYYEDVEDKSCLDYIIQVECKSFKEAKEKLKETIEKIAEDRKKVRQPRHEESAYIVF
jgi:predicted P-loop ATPase/GTPase